MSADQQEALSVAVLQAKTSALFNCNHIIGSLHLVYVGQPNLSAATVALALRQCQDAVSDLKEKIDAAVAATMVGSGS